MFATNKVVTQSCGDSVGKIIETLLQRANYHFGFYRFILLSKVGSPLIEAQRGNGIKLRLESPFEASIFSGPFTGLSPKGQLAGSF